MRILLENSRGWGRGRVKVVGIQGSMPKSEEKKLDFQGSRWSLTEIDWKSSGQLQKYPQHGGVLFLSGKTKLIERLYLKNKKRKFNRNGFLKSVFSLNY